MSSLRHIKIIQVLIQDRSDTQTKQLLTLPDELRALKSQTKILTSGLNELRKMASYSFYTRLFSLWHLFHLPIFFMMLITGIVHVFVVHIY